MNVAIITGASSGMGRAFAQRIAADNSVDELWLVARRRDRLEELASHLDKPCRCLPADLSDTTQIDGLAVLLKKEHPDVRYLVNDAGLGKMGTWQTIDAAGNDAMIDVNCRALVRMSTAVLPFMGRGSHLLQIDSCAAFTPLPHLGVYAASKAFVQSYTRSLRWELHGRGIAATAICPGWVKTEFAAVARGTDDAHDVRHLLGAQKPETVVRRALLANRLHFAIATCGIGAFLLRILGKFLPHCITMAGWEGVRRL